MVQRTAKRDDNFDKRFWGCMAYPACRGTSPLDKLDLPNGHANLHG